MITSIIMLAIGLPFTGFLSVLLYSTVSLTIKNQTGIEDLIEHKKMNEYYTLPNWKDNVLDQIKVDPKLRLFDGWVWVFRFFFNLNR